MATQDAQTLVHTDTQMEDLYEEAPDLVFHHVQDRELW